MSKNNYIPMAGLFRDTFQDRRVAIFPIDHGGAKQAQNLMPYLHGAGVNFVMYERRGAGKPQENCLDQGNLHLYEVRQIVTPRRQVRAFLKNAGEVDDIAVLDDWATSRGMPSLGGAWAYFVMLGYSETKTAAFRDRCGGTDISPDKKSEHEYKGTRDYLRRNSLDITHFLIRNGYLIPEAEDSTFLDLEESSWTERLGLSARRYADQLITLTSPSIVRHLRKGDFIKEAADRAARTAAIM